MTTQTQTQDDDREMAWKENDARIYKVPNDVTKGVGTVAMEKAAEADGEKSPSRATQAYDFEVMREGGDVTTVVVWDRRA